MASQWAQPASQGSPQMGGGWSSVLSGYQQASTPSWITKGFLERNLAPYKKFGLTQNLKKLEGMSPAQREREAAQAILKKNHIHPRPAPKGKVKHRGMA